MEKEFFISAPCMVSVNYEATIKLNDSQLKEIKDKWITEDQYIRDKIKNYWLDSLWDFEYGEPDFYNVDTESYWDDFENIIIDEI